MDEKPIQVQLGDAAAFGETGGRTRRGCTWKQGYGYGTLGLVMLLTEVLFSFTNTVGWKTARNRMKSLTLSFTLSYLIYLFSGSVNFPLISHGFPCQIGASNLRARCCTWQKMPTCRGSWPRRCWPSVRTRQKCKLRCWLKTAILTMGFHKWGIPRCVRMENPIKMDDLGVRHILGNLHVNIPVSKLIKLIEFLIKQTWSKLFTNIPS